MKTVTQYREDLAALMKKVGDIDAQAITANRDCTPAELLTKNELLDAVEDVRKTVSTMDRQEQMSADLQKPTGPVASRQALTPPNPDRPKDRFLSFGEQMSAVMRAGLPNGHADPRLRIVGAAGTGLSESVPSDGGFLVQQDFANELLQNIYETGVLAGKCRRIPISAKSNSIKINGVDESSRATGSRSGGIVGYWADEADEKTKSKPKFRKIELNLKKLIGLCYATDELLDDAAALEGVIRDGFRDEFGFLVDDAIVNGTGAGQPLGFLNSGSLVSVTKETSQKAATIVAENIIKMYSRRFAGQTNNYVWLYNQMIEPQLFTMNVAVGLGGIPVYMPPGGLSDAPYGRVLGLPAIAIEQAAALGTVGDIVLANLPNGYILAEKGGIKSDMSIHVRFVYDESVFRFVLRIDGQPVRATVMTPYKGGATATQSHFIALETRA